MEVTEKDVKVHSNGEVTIPADVVAKAGLRAGDDARLIEFDGRFHLVPVEKCAQEIIESFKREEAALEALTAGWA